MQGLRNDSNVAYYIAIKPVRSVRCFGCSVLDCIHNLEETFQSVLPLPLYRINCSYWPNIDHCTFKMMKALRFHGQNDIRLEEVEVPKCGQDQVKVRLYVSWFGNPTNFNLGKTGLRWHLWHRFVASSKV